MYQILQKYRAKESPYVYVFTAAIFLAFHYYFITYINSTFLEQFIGRSNLGIIYSIGSFFTIFLFLKTSGIIKRFKAFNFIVFLSILEIFCLLTLAFSNSPLIIILAFVLHHSVNPTILVCLDTYLEDTGNKKHMGTLRGTFLTILSLAAVISPLAIGSFVAGGEFQKIYLFSAFFMLLFLFSVIINFKNLPSGQFKKIKILASLKEFFQDKNIIYIGITSGILQFFYSWMIIYVPLYLWDVMKFSWSEVAMAVSIGLLPFLLFEIPIGKIVDKNRSEKKILCVGFLISSIAVFLFSFLPPTSFLLWAGVLFLSRTGAALIETANESYFFRAAKGRDELIGIYRVSGPLAFIIGPLTGSVLLYFLEFRMIFPVLSAIMLLGIFFALKLKRPRIGDIEI